MEHEPPTRPDRPRALVALIQRRSLSLLPVWGSLALSGYLLTSGLTQPGSLGPLVVIAAGCFLMLWLRLWHRRHYGDVRASEALRIRGYLTGVACLMAFVVTLLAGPNVIPAPMPFVFAFVMASIVIWEPWRVSLHWLLPAIVFLWLSVVNVVDAPWLAGQGVLSLLTGIVGVVTCAVDHIVMVRMLRHAPGGMAMGAQHA